jgi:hypothetical protein
VADLDTAAPQGAASPDVNAAQAAPPDGGASTVTEGGAAPLTPYQRRKAKQDELKKLAAERRAKREAKKAEKGGAKAPAAPADEVDDEDRDDDQRKRETSGAWRLTLRVVSLVLWPFGYRLDPLTDKEAAEDAGLLLPLVRKHRWLDALVAYAALPYLLAERVALKLKKREAEKKETAKP